MPHPWLSAIVALCLLVSCVIYPTHSVGTRRRKDLPGPLGLPLVGNLIEFLLHRKAVLFYISTLEERYGELFSFTMPGWGRSIVLNRPEWLEHVRKYDGSIYGKGTAALSIFAEFPGSSSALGAEGQTWRLSRRLMKPIFVTHTFSADVSHTMHEVVPLAREFLSNVCKQNSVIDFNEFSGRLALAIFCKMSFDYDTDLIPSCADHMMRTHPMVEAVSVLSSISSERLYNPFWKITEQLDGKGRRFRSSRQFCYETIEHIVRTRHAAFAQNKSDKHKDFLGALLRDTEVQEDPKALRETLVTLLFAGRDNVQNVLSWSVYELSQSPSWMEKMQAEWSHGGRRADSIISYEELQDYPIHLAVFYETLRLWPGIPKNARVAMRDDVIPALPGEEHGPIVVHKGDYVLWSDYAMMRNEKVWGTDAKIFNPGRHLSEEGRFIKPPTPRFHAFGAGARACPGAQLAAYEFACIWIDILHYFRITPETAEKCLPSDSLTINMDGPFLVRVVSQCDDSVS